MTAPPAEVAPLTAAQLAVHVGWTMAVLYRLQDTPVGQPGDSPAGAAPAGDSAPHETAPDATAPDPAPAAPAPPAQLPTVHELPAAERKRLELGRLGHLLTILAALPECARSGMPTDVSGIDPTAPDFKDKLADFNLLLLEAMAAAEPETELSYEVGRSLRDTVNPPAGAQSRAAELARLLGRSRVSRIQEWLGTLAAQFPPHAASIVGRSIGFWSELAAVTISTSQKTALKRGDSEEFAKKMGSYLLPQGDLWLLLLVGTRPTSGLLSPEGYVAAGEAALRRSTKIVRKVVQHYWVVLALLAVALAVVLYLAVSYLGGAARVWTSIAAIATSMGISAQAIASATGRLAAEAERPVIGLEEEDAMAWAITMMPRADLTALGVRQLRRAGVAPSVGLGEA